MFSEVSFRWEQGLLPSLPPSHKEYARIQEMALEIQTSTQWLATGAIESEWS